MSFLPGIKTQTQSNSKWPESEKNPVVGNDISIHHEKLSIQVDLPKRRIEGYAELRFYVPESSWEGTQSASVRINCRQMHVSAVAIRTPYQSQPEEESVPYSLDRNLLDLPLVADSDEKKGFGETLRSRWQHTTSVAEEGELAVALPRSVLEKLAAANQWADVDDEVQQHRLVVTVRIYYELISPSGGACFIPGSRRGSHTYPPQMYTSNVSGARLWMPCIDSPQSLITWELEIFVDPDHFAVASGSLVDHVLESEMSKKTMRYELDIPTTPNKIAICVGPFTPIPDPTETASLTYFCSPGLAKALRNTVQVVSTILQFVKDFLGENLPYDSLTICFVEGTCDVTASYPGCIVCNAELLHSDAVIDRAVEVRVLLARAIARQWFGCFLPSGGWSDDWLVEGIAGLISMRFLEFQFGRNELKRYLIEEMRQVAKIDTEPVSLSQKNASHHPSGKLSFLPPRNISLFRHSVLVMRKAPLVLYLIERRIGGDVLRRHLAEYIRNGMTATGLAEGPDSPTGTQQPMKTERFFREVKVKYLFDLDKLAENYIFGYGMPRFECGFVFNRRDRRVEFAVKQVLEEGQKPFTGQLLVQVTETEGSFDHVVEINEAVQLHHFDCHAHVRRRAQSSVPLRGRGGLGGTPITPGAVDDAELLEDQTLSIHGTPILWIRIDPDIEWIRTISFAQPSFMWVNQLRRDMDVGAQLEAIAALQQLPSLPSAAVTKSLDYVMRNTKIYYVVRAAAAKALAVNCTRSVKEEAQRGGTLQEDRIGRAWQGMSLLMEYYRSKFYSNRTYVKPNNFFNFPEYFVQKAIVHALSIIRNAQDGTPRDILKFLLEILKQNDNSQNSYSDSFFLACALRAIAHVRSDDVGLSSASLPENRALRQLEVMLRDDEINPSHARVVTAACLVSICELAAAGRSSLDNFDPIKLFSAYEKNSEKSADRLNLVSLRCLLYLGYHAQADSPIQKVEMSPAVAALGNALDIIMSPNEYTPDTILLAARSILAPLDLDEPGDLNDAAFGFGRAEIDISSLIHAGAALNGTRIPPYMKPFRVKANPLKGADEIAQRLWNIINQGALWDDRLRETLLVLYQCLFSIGSRRPLWTIQKEPSLFLKLPSQTNLV